MSGKWVAKKDQDIGTRFVHAGEDCPEAADWPNLRAWVNAGYVEWVETPDEPAPEPASEPAVEAPPTVASAAEDAPAAASGDDEAIPEPTAPIAPPPTAPRRRRR